MINWSDPRTYVVGRGTITMRKGMYMGVAVIHERTATTPRAMHPENVSDKFYPEFLRLPTGRPRHAHFLSEQELVEAIRLHHSAPPLATWPLHFTSLHTR